MNQSRSWKKSVKCFAATLVEEFDSKVLLNLVCFSVEWVNVILKHNPLSKLESLLSQLNLAQMMDDITHISL